MSVRAGIFEDSSIHLEQAVSTTDIRRAVLTPAVAGQ